MNIMVTSSKGLEARASAEFKELALLFGLRKFTIERSSYDGILEIDAESPKEFLTFFRAYVKSEPFRVRFIQRIVPIDAVVDTKVPELKKAFKALADHIQKHESFRITIESRDSPYTNKELIEAIAEQIDRKVNLESPDKVALVEVFGEYTAVSVLSPGEIISVPKLKRGV